MPDLPRRSIEAASSRATRRPDVEGAGAIAGRCARQFGDPQGQKILDPQP